MSEFTKAMIVYTRAMRALIRVLGMQAENQSRERHGLALAYDEAAFAAVIDAEGIGENAVLGFLKE